MEMKARLADGGFRAFLWIWIGQVVSNLGSGLTRFAIGVWVFQETGSATRFTLIAFFATIPAIALSPIAGALVDRWNRRRTMMLSDAGAAVTTVLLVFLLANDALEIWQIYLLVALSSAFNALQVPAFSAATTLLVPKVHFGRASGMNQFGQAAGRVLAPLMAGALMGWIAIEGVILVDLATFLFAVAVLSLVRVPEPERKSPAPGARRPSLLREAAYGWTYIWQRPGLVRLLGYFAMLNLILPFGLVLTTPLVLSFAGAEELGVVLGLASSGALVGGALMSAWGGPRRRVMGVLAAGPLVSLGLAIAGLRPSLVLIGAGFFLITLVVPVVNGCSQAIWQSKVAPEVQGRVFAMRRMIAQFTGPLAFLGAGPLADHVFIPLLEAGGPLASTLGPLVGVGPGRGIGLLFLVLAALFLAFTGLFALSPRLRNLEDEIEDAVD
ncbi:MAG: MFS transporter [Acidobacteriota bacterium]|nr:MFS transporter [Acidobacteriota bacterium]